LTPGEVQAEERLVTRIIKHGKSRNTESLPPGPQPLALRVSGILAKTKAEEFSFSKMGPLPPPLHFDPAHPQVATRAGPLRPLVKPVAAPSG
jgi:hypothetical protein